MEAYIVITEADVLAKLLEPLLAGCTVYTSSAGRLVVERGASHVYIVQDQSVREDYLDEPTLPATARDASNFYLLEFNDRSLAREIVAAFAANFEGWVDDDHGSITRLEHWKA
jgi:hypothetical protein